MQAALEVLPQNTVLGLFLPELGHSLSSLPPQQRRQVEASLKRSEHLTKLWRAGRMDELEREWGIEPRSRTPRLDACNAKCEERFGQARREELAELIERTFSEDW
ncbi:MAG: hypothetical protein KDA42_06140 [Planctomycetales bacterium]|nr:hypothetical protein [Planctomycetales bacterium]